MSPKKLLRLSVVAILFLITPAAAATISEIAQYKGADRQEKLERGAREEKELNFYTSINTNTSMPILQAFEKRYPFIKTKLTRMDSEGSSIVLQQSTQPSERSLTLLTSAILSSSTCVERECCRAFIHLLQLISISVWYNRTASGLPLDIPLLFSGTTLIW